jgi:hypothetical protein
VFRDWLLIDELQLELELALITFPGTGRSQGELIDALRYMPGVRQIIETEHARDVLAIVIFAGPRQRRELRARLSELSDQLIWDNILQETHEPAAITWRALALQAAADERLRA